MEANAFEEIMTVSQPIILKCFALIRTAPLRPAFRTLVPVDLYFVAISITLNVAQEKAAQLLKKDAKKFKIVPNYTVTMPAFWPLWITCVVIGKKWASMTLAFGALINIAGTYTF